MLQTVKVDNRKSTESLAARMFDASISLVVAVGTAPVLVAGAVARLFE